MEEDKIVRIKLKQKTREALKACGIKGDTYDYIIWKLLKANKERFIERLKTGKKK